MGCPQAVPAGTTDGTVLAQMGILPDGSGQLGALVAVSPTSTPVERVIFECTDTPVQTEYFRGIFSVLRLRAPTPEYIDSLVVVAPGDLERSIDRTVQDDMLGTITEQTTVEMRVVQ
jgi:hypothetical protein